MLLFILVLVKIDFSCEKLSLLYLWRTWNVNLLRPSALSCLWFPVVFGVHVTINFHDTAKINDGPVPCLISILVRYNAVRQVWHSSSHLKRENFSTYFLVTSCCPVARTERRWGWRGGRGGLAQPMWCVAAEEAAPAAAGDSAAALPAATPATRAATRGAAQAPRKG